MHNFYYLVTIQCQICAWCCRLPAAVTVEDTGIALELHGNCTGIAWEFHWNCPGIALEFHWNCTGVSLELHGNCIGIALELLWSFTGVALEILVSIPPQQMFHLQGHSLHGIFVLLEMLQSEISWASSPPSNSLSSRIKP